MTRPRAVDDEALSALFPATVRGIAVALHASQWTVRDRLDVMVERGLAEVFLVGSVKVYLYPGDRPLLHDLLSEAPSEVDRLLDRLR